MDWSEEEMYLVISEFLRKLSMDAGIAISHIGNRQLSASFVLEVSLKKKLITIFKFYLTGIYKLYFYFFF